MEKENSTTPANDAVVLRVEIGVKQIVYEKLAPNLPCGVSWSTSMVVDLCSEEFVDIDMIVVKETGQVTVFLDRLMEFDEELLIANGWRRHVANGTNASNNIDNT